MSKKGENIYKRKDGRWEARYSKGVLASGKIKYGYCYGKTYREAKDKVEKIKSSLALGFSTTKQQRKIFSAYCDEWLQLNKNKVKESTYVKYSTAIEKHVKTFLGGYSVQAINSLTVGEFCSHLLCVDKLSSKTVRDILTLLKSILNYTSKQVNLPVIDIVYPKEEKQEIKVLSLEEQKIFTDYLKSDMDNCKFGILLALMTGLRIGEVCSLRWCDISIENMSLSVTSTMQRVKNIDDTNSSKTKIVISKPKSNTSSRVIPLTPYAVEMCKNRISTQKNAFILTGKTESFMEPRTLQYRMKKYTKECNLEGVHFHVLRHTFATRCVELGFEIKSLSEILGHANPKITLERYVHSSMQLKRDNMNKLAAIGF